MPGLGEYYGQRQLPEALVAVATQPQIDVVVVRDALTDPDTLDWLARPEVVDDPECRLHEAIPSLTEADAAVRTLWRQIGYTGMSVHGTINVDSYRETGVDPHVDVALWPDFPVEAVAMGSLCLRGQRVFAAEKLLDQFKCTDGSFDGYGYDAHWAVRIAGEGRPDRLRWPRTEVEVGAGDMVLFAHHPAMTLHAVRHAKGRSSVARLLSWTAENRVAQPA